MLTKIMVVSGFLGSGKTTSMLALANYIDSNIGKASIIVNDLGSNLVDTKYSLKMNKSITEIPSGCICYQMDNVINKLYNIEKKEKPNIIISDIPGCGVGALDHVYHKLNKDYSDHFELVPFTVIVDPERLKILIDIKNAEIMNINKELSYLMIKQLEEADLIVLNKIDLISELEIEKNLNFLKSLYPNTTIIPISAKYNKNIDIFANYILNNTSQLKNIEIEQEKFVNAENLLSWYNRRISIITEKPIDINKYAEELMNLIKEKLIEKRANTLHFKIFAHNIEDHQEDYLKYSLIGTDHNIEFDNKMKNITNKISLVINMRSIIQSEELYKIINEVLDHLSIKYNIKTITHFLESFGVMDPK